MRAHILWLCLSALVVVCKAQSAANEIEPLRKQLASGTTSAQALLTDPRYMHLHPETAFRELIKQHAPMGQLTMVTADEPGTRITVECTLQDAAGRILTNAVVYVYQTSAKGWYAQDAPHVTGNSGDYKHARLFGYVRTDAQGRFLLYTIQPAGYPDSDLPAHIHLHAEQGGVHLVGLPNELLFDNDPRLTPTRRQAALRQGYLISKNSGTLEKPVFRYVMQQR